MRIVFLTLFLMLGFVVIGSAQSTETAVLRHGQQRTLARGDIKIKFISVEDSRCPANARCIWAGNGQVTALVTDRRGLSKTITVNTNTGPHGDQFGGYAINLVSLSTKPTGRRRSATGYTATFSVARLYR